MPKKPVHGFILFALYSGVARYLLVDALGRWHDHDARCQTRKHFGIKPFVNFTTEMEAYFKKIVEEHVTEEEELLIEAR